MKIVKVVATLLMIQWVHSGIMSQSEEYVQSDYGIDEIILKHIEATGGMENIKSLQNLFFQSPGGAMMSVGRPYYKLVGDKNNPRGYMEGYDGSAWEWFENPGVVIRTVGEASEAIRHYAGVESPLVDYKEKGNQVEVLGEVLFDENPTLVLKLTRRDNFVEKYYLDKKTFLKVASSYDAPLHAFGIDITTLTRFSDYRWVGGVHLPHHYASVELPSGKDLGSVQWTIEANKQIPDDWFSPPEFKRSPIQAFIEQLYNQRDDIGAVMWTYHEFRNAHRSIDTSDPVNVAGYQMLKMDQVKNAVALLEQNVIDNPVSASSRFGLGRAYRTANETQKAKLQFLEALRIDPQYERAMKALEGL